MLLRSIVKLQVHIQDYLM